MWDWRIFHLSMRAPEQPRMHTTTHKHAGTHAGEVIRPHKSSASIACSSLCYHWQRGAPIGCFTCYYNSHAHTHAVSTAPRNLKSADFYSRLLSLFRSIALCAMPRMFCYLALSSHKNLYTCLGFETRCFTCCFGSFIVLCKFI